MSRHDSESDAFVGINDGYAHFQLSRALTAARENDADPQTLDRIERWRQVVGHLVQGSALYGSRTPFADLPEWVTLEVATGGFATGKLLAGGELTLYERRLAALIPGIRVGFERLDLNTWHLSDEGVGSLQAYLAKGNYQIDVPEEAALLTVAWFLKHQRIEEARTLIERIAPFFERLRFFPTVTDKQPFSMAEVEVFNVGYIRPRLSKSTAQPRLAVQKHVVENSLPLYDAAISLFLLTYQESWPCRYYPEGWFQRGIALGAQFDKTFESDPRSAGSSMNRVVELHALLKQCSFDPASLTGRQVGRIRKIVDDFLAKHGHPESEAHSKKRARQRDHVKASAHHLIAKAVSARLANYPDSEGISDFPPLLEPITSDEANLHAVMVGDAVPLSVRRRLERCRKGTVAELIDQGVITSGDTVARVLPTMTAEICSAGYRDATLRTLSVATYRAFRRRRSLLLLDMQRQVKIGDIPWVSALESEYEANASAVEGAKQALIEASALTLSAFPQAIIPNKLLQEFSSLVETAKLDLPIVEEVAADIFMGAFSSKFVKSARQSARMLTGSLYARYYDIDTDQLANLPDPPKSRRTRSYWQRSTNNSDALARLCTQRANVDIGTRHPATNGTIIEQQQIVTTQNLATLFGVLGLREVLHDRLSAMAQSCFEWICRRQQIQIQLYHARLVMLKNTAYAWRQMMFYLSMLDPVQLQSALKTIEMHFAAQSSEFRERFLPAMIGLRIAASGHPLTESRQKREGGKVFLGWTTERHWLMPS
ncbi:hypothetical protein DLD99_12275 [Pseudomonas kribbensis]|uniref:Uncharacterized protein n=1 Tax=Pseudomonas kribbensis TaxID=1628086 RepID=A0A345RPJ9_9PSED|nr:hypothetical protein [Pseudomonas kribbensis]AXI61215.1 hypothetical protein DLD99_12275 [Pseudomonas kribbensis]